MPLLSWIWFPLLLLGVALGLGLLAERIARARMPFALVVPVGFALAILLVDPVYRLGLTRPAALAVLLVPAAVGLVLGRRTLREHLRPGPAALAGLAVYLLYLAPVLLSGDATFAGYNFTNDPSLNFTAIDWIATHGFNSPAAPGASTYEIVARGQIEVGYPLGVHVLMMTLEPLTGAGLLSLYQPVIALTAAVAAVGFFSVARHFGMPPIAAVAAGVVPMGANLVYVYGLLGGLKEVATVALLATAAALAVWALSSGLRLREVALAALPLAAIVPVLSTAAFAYGGVLAAAVLVAAVAGVARRASDDAGREPRPVSGWPAAVRPSLLRLVLAVGVAGVVLLVASSPSLSSALRFGSTASGAFNADTGASTGVLGQLVRPLPVSQAAGVWLTEDWRGAVQPGMRALVTDGLGVLIAILAVTAILIGAFRRRWGPVLVLAPALAVAAVGLPRLSPYGDSKLLVVLSPAILFAAACGCWLLTRRSRVAGALVAAAVVFGVLWTDAFQYRGVRLAPMDRLAALEDAGDAAHGKGLVLLNEWEEYGKYLLRDAQVNIPNEDWGPRQIVLRRPEPVFGQYFDLDEMDLKYVTGFPAIITRRSPEASRPPASFRSVYRNRFYELWQRDPAMRVVDHLPLQGERLQASRRPSCATVLRFARRARPGERLVAWAPGARPTLDVEHARRSPGLVPVPESGGMLVPKSPGQAVGPVRLAPGRYTVWLRGSSGRPLDVRVDGREVGVLKTVNTPEQWQDVGKLDVSRDGRRTVEVRRPGGDLTPGNAYQGLVGPVVFEPERSGAMLTVSPAEAARLCGRELDWIERVRA